MSNWKHRLETKFAYFSLAIMKRPKLSLLLFLLIIAGFGQSLRFVEIDPEMESFVEETAPVRVIYDRVKEEFGRNDIVMLALRGDVMSTDFLTRLQAMQRRIENDVPYVEDVTSIINAPYQRGTEDALEVLDLIETIPQTPAEFTQLEQRIQESTLASSVLVNDTRTMALMMIEPATYDYAAAGGETADVDSFDDAFSEDLFSADAFEADAGDASIIENDIPFVTQFQIRDMLAELEAIQAEYVDLNPLMAGIPAMNDALEGTMQSEMLFFLRLTVVLIVLTLVAFFRQANAVIAPMLAVLAALIFTMSMLVISGNKVQIPLVLLPSFLLAITIGDAVHLLTHFYRKIQLGEDKKDAMFHAVHRTAIPMLLTSLTTAGGLLSLSIADVVPIRNLGIFSAIGVMMAFLLTVTVIPALVMVIPMRNVKADSSHAMVAGWIEWVGKVSWQHGGKIALFWLVASLLSITQITKLQFSHDPLNWMPDNLQIVQSTQTIDDELSGTMTLDLILDTGNVNGVKDLQFLNTLAQWQEELEVYKKGPVEIKGVNSLIDIIKESNRALQGGGDDQYRLPDSQSLLNEEIFLFENSAADTLYQLVDADFTKTKVTLVLPWSDLMFYSAFVDEIAVEGNRRFGDMAQVDVTGMIALMSGTMVKLVFDTASSYLVAAFVIALMMMLLLNSIPLGLLAMIPNIAPILVVMGLMYPLGIQLDMLTMLVATIAIGIAVDNTVHFTHHFRHGLEQGHSVQAAMQDAFAGAGQALFTTCIVLTAGFYVFLFSDVHSIFNLGFLCGTAFILAMISNFTLTPFLLRWYYRHHKESAVSAH